jgi:opacity protein-like surface antigen
MRHLVLFASMLTALAATAQTANAQIDVEGVLMVGTGINTSDEDSSSHDPVNNNPYALQFGGAAELTLAGWVVGVRGTRSLATNDKCDTTCANVKDLRTVGIDLGWDYELLLLHLSPRVGLGYINEKGGDRVAGYVEPGGVLEAEVGIFVAGIDVRYRFAMGEKELNGLLGYARLGLRF